VSTTHCLLYPMCTTTPVFNVALGNYVIAAWQPGPGEEPPFVRLNISLIPNGLWFLPRARRVGARILDPMAELIVDDKDLVVRLTLGEKVWGLHGDIRVRLSSIVSVAPDPNPWRGLRGWRMAGVSVPGVAGLGTRRHGSGYDFCILHRDRPAVQVNVGSGRFSRLVISVPEGGDPHTEAARIAGAAGIAPSAPAS
jgi:hypothetical protein